MTRECLLWSLLALLDACSPAQRTSSETHFVSCATDVECTTALGPGHACNNGWCTPPPKPIGDARAAPSPAPSDDASQLVCGDGKCSPGETAHSCPSDCMDLPDATPSASAPSCSGLAATCGPNHDADCCASPLIPGGTYNRSNLASFPATLSDFRLDKYEITVGRFRKFIQAYSRDMIANGAGKNPNDPSDPGWNAAWNANLPADSTALMISVECEGQIGSTYRGTATPEHESRPVNCIDWYRAFAFCVWDGGRLPTEAEWNYAAAGGREQRPFPWGYAAGTDGGVTPDATYAVYNCYFNGNGSCTDVSNIAPVGSASAGDGKWGQSDLAGNLWEWTLDAYTDPYQPGTCHDCANFSTTPTDGHVPGRAMRGGNYRGPVLYLTTGYRLEFPMDWGRDDAVGARCARAP